MGARSPRPPPTTNLPHPNQKSTLGVPVRAENLYGFVRLTGLNARARAEHVMTRHLEGPTAQAPWHRPPFASHGLRATILTPYCRSWAPAHLPRPVRLPTAAAGGLPRAEPDGRLLRPPCPRRAACASSAPPTRRGRWRERRGGLCSTATSFRKPVICTHAVSTQHTDGDARTRRAAHT